MKLNSKRFRNLFVYTFATVIILILIVLSMTTYVYNGAKQNAEQTLHLQTKQIKSDFENQLTSDEENLSTVANIILNLHNSGEDLSLMFRSFEAIGFIENIAVLSPDNVLHTKRGEMSVNELDYFEEIEKGRYISDVVKDVTNPALDLVRIGIPIVDENGETIYMLYGSILVDTFEKRYKSVVDMYGADIWILKNDKIVFSTTKTENDLNIDSEQIVFDGEEEEFFTYKNEETGKEYYGHYSSINIGTTEMGGWQIVVLMPESTVFAEANSTIRQLMSMFLALLAVMSLYVIFMTGSIRHHLKISECASKTRKILLDTNNGDENIAIALSKLCSFVKSRSAFFIDSTGEDFNYVKPEFESELLRGEKRKYFIDTVFKYVEDSVTDDKVTVKVYKLFVDEKLHKNNPKFYDFLKANGMKSIVFAYSVNRENLITVAGFINPKVNTAMYLLADLAVCISMAVYNKRYLDRIENIAVTDSLTGVSNRVACNRDINKFASNIPEFFACIYVDVNELHTINDKYGHAAGDKMLIFVAQALKQSFSESNIYRMGGDEFVVFTQGIVKDELMRRIEHMHENIQAAGYHVAVGVDYYKGHEHIESLVKEAEKRMYIAKAEYYQSKHEGKMAELVSADNYYMESGIEAVDSFFKIAGIHYYGIFAVSLKDDSYKILMAAQEFKKHSDGVDDFKEFFMKYAYDDASHDYYRELVNFRRYDVLQKKLENGEIPSIVYERTDGSNVLLSIYSVKDDEKGSTLWIFEKI